MYMKNVLQDIKIHSITFTYYCVEKLERKS